MPLALANVTSLFRSLDVVSVSCHMFCLQLPLWMRDKKTFLGDVVRSCAAAKVLLMDEQKIYA